MTRYIVREKWPGCKKWESPQSFSDQASALAEYDRRVYVAPEDGYKVQGTDKRKITVQCVKVELIRETKL